LVKREVTTCLGPFHDAVRPVCSSERAPPWNTLVFEDNDPAPNTLQPVVPLSMLPFVNRLPLWAAGAACADNVASSSSARTAARHRERIVDILFLFILFSLSLQTFAKLSV
jgi:hypothetical protein